MSDQCGQAFCLLSILRFASQASLGRAIYVYGYCAYALIQAAPKWWTGTG